MGCKLAHNLPTSTATHHSKTSNVPTVITSSQFILKLQTHRSEWYTR